MTSPTTSPTVDELQARIGQLEATVQLRTQQLLASTSRAYSFLDTLHLGFIMCDVNGEVVLTNSSVRQLLAPNEPRRDWTLEAIDAALPAAFALRDEVATCLATGNPSEHAEVAIGQRVARLFIAPLTAENDTGGTQILGAVILAEDITEQTVLERSKDEFLSIASHELRTPLTAIRGNAALIQKHYADKIVDPDMAEMIADIHESSVRLINIVNDFLDVSAMEQGKITMNPERFGLAELVESVLRELHSVAVDKGVELVNDPANAAAPAVYADTLRIKQVVYNLVGNALKFTDRGQVTVTSRVVGSYVYVVVVDTGRGIPPEAQKLLFRKFQQAGGSLLTRDTTKGTGLGLYISKLIVELSGGKIGLGKSVPGHGSAFVFSLPISPAG